MTMFVRKSTEGISSRENRKASASFRKSRLSARFPFRYSSRSMICPSNPEVYTPTKR